MTYVILRLVWLRFVEGRTIASDEMRKEEEIGDLWRSFFLRFSPFATQIDDRSWICQLSRDCSEYFSTVKRASGGQSYHLDLGMGIWEVVVRLPRLFLCRFQRTSKLFLPSEAYVTYGNICYCNQRDQHHQHQRTLEKERSRVGYLRLDFTSFFEKKPYQKINGDLFHRPILS